MKELSDEEIKSEVDAIMKRIDQIVKNIGELFQDKKPLSEEQAE